MTGKTFIPSKDLADFVMCYWTLESSINDTPEINTIVPDGTMKLIFHYGATYRHHPKNTSPYLLPKCFLIGQLTRPYVVEPTGETGTFMVRFHPNGFLPFTNQSIKTMENTAIPLKELFGKKGIEFETKILSAPNNEERIKITEDFLRHRLSDQKTLDTILTSAIETISTANGQIPIHEISDKLEVNRRNLVRKFSTNVGLSPKQLSKIIRLQASLKVLLNKKNSKLTEVAHNSEYFDQAHFIKDFKEFTGITPKEFYGTDLNMSLIFDKEN